MKTVCPTHYQAYEVGTTCLYCHSAPKHVPHSLIGEPVIGALLINYYLHVGGIHYGLCEGRSVVWVPSMIQTHYLEPAPEMAGSGLLAFFDVCTQKGKPLCLTDRWENIERLPPLTKCSFGSLHENWYLYSQNHAYNHNVTLFGLGPDMEGVQRGLCYAFYRKLGFDK